MHIQKKKTYVAPQLEELALIEMTNLCSDSKTKDPDEGLDNGEGTDTDLPDIDGDGNYWGD